MPLSSIARLPRPVRATQSRRLRRGVTLVEMAIVLVIVGLMMAMVIPRVGRGVAARQLDRASQQLVVDMQTAGQLAARHRRPVQFRNSGMGYEIVDKATPTTVYVKRNLGSASGTNATTMSFSPGTLDFYPNGLTSVSTANATYTVTVAGMTRTVTVTRVGHARRQ